MNKFDITGGQTEDIDIATNPSTDYVLTAWCSNTGGDTLAEDHWTSGNDDLTIDIKDTEAVITATELKISVKCS